MTPSWGELGAEPMHWVRFARSSALALAFALALTSQSSGADRSDHTRKVPLPGMPVFIDIQPIVLPVIEGSNVTGQVGVLLTVELVQGRDVSRNLAAGLILFDHGHHSVGEPFHFVDVWPGYLPAISSSLAWRWRASAGI